MEEFLRLDWTPRPEDILSDRYVNEQRLKNESVTHKILLGSFSNPFSDVRMQNKAISEKPKGSSTLNPKGAPKSIAEASRPTNKT